MIGILTTLALLTVGVSGCGNDKGTNPAPVGFQGPDNTTPANALARFHACWKQQAIAPYGELFTADYRFGFSTAQDYDLVATYGDTWDVVHEVRAAEHVFNGFHSDSGYDFPGAVRISLVLGNVAYVDDPAHADSSAHCRVALVGNADLVVEMPGDDGAFWNSSEPHVFYLVRGDAAVLAADQPADSQHWYIRRWVDRSAPGGFLSAASGRALGSLRPLGSANLVPSWGYLKAVYDH